MNYNKFITYIDELKAFCGYYNKNKLQSILKKYNLNHAIINDQILWKMYFNPDIFVESQMSKLNSINTNRSNSSDDLEERIKEIVEKSMMLKDTESRLDL